MDLSGVQFHEVMHNLPAEHPLRPKSHGEVQLPLFMSAHEIQQSHQPLFGDRHGWESTLGEQGGSGSTQTPYGWEPDQEHETDAQLWERKADEADQSDLADHIRTEGVHSAVQLGMTPQPHLEEGDHKPEIVGGHHRIAVSAIEAHHRLMPVLFHDRRDIPKGARTTWGTPVTPTDINAARNNQSYPYDHKVPGYSSWSESSW